MPASMYGDKDGKRKRRRFKSMELDEISAVGSPAQREARADFVKSEGLFVSEEVAVSGDVEKAAGAAEVKAEPVVKAVESPKLVEVYKSLDGVEYTDPAMVALAKRADTAEFEKRAGTEFAKCNAVSGDVVKAVLFSRDVKAAEGLAAVEKRLVELEGAVSKSSGQMAEMMRAPVSSLTVVGADGAEGSLDEAASAIQKSAGVDADEAMLRAVEG